MFLGTLKGAFKIKCIIIIINIKSVSASTVCDYCSTGDLYTYWVMIGRFSEDTVRVYAAELGSALGE